MNPSLARQSMSVSLGPVNAYFIVAAGFARMQRAKNGPPQGIPCQGRLTKRCAG
ncbi:hypothetical protein [Vogesella indigofera]|uniref:hypothetical protein n=1 Tax=Vogesella indigofera TaxID=45465 RepID=UPI00234DAF1A|nr:hypothetical protein [Vogesella indigofera]MDC7703135.1 hypothetical protein [Vogesella indigofera]MDC7706439.1 hypothetical protein [Vogesella indigofera]